MTKLLPVLFCDTIIYLLPLLSSFFIIINSHLNWLNTYINFKFKKNKPVKLKYFNLFILKNILLILCLYEISNKTTQNTFVFWLIPVLLLISYFIFLTLNWITINNNKYFGFNYFILLPIIYSVKVLLQVNNILITFLIIELINYIIYFQFLTFFSKLTKNTKNRQFDSILIYFWSTFISLILLLFWLVYQLQLFNTTNFYEINFLNLSNTDLSTLNTVFFLGIFIKFGAVGLHLLKAEVYKSLKVDSILIFSIITLFVYLQILYIFLDNLQIVYSLYKTLLYFVLIIFSSLVVFVLANTNVLNILALSSVINMTILLIVNLN